MKDWSSTRVPSSPADFLPLPPWEGPPLPRCFVEESQEETPAPRRLSPSEPPVKSFGTFPSYQAGPGCKAADSCLLVHGYLVHLAEGQSGFGVLRVAKERMEEGALGAERMGQGQLAHEMRQVAQELPEVRTPKQAAALAPKLKELSDQTWDLGRRCGGHFSPQLMAKAQALGSKVAKGEVPRDQAVAELRQRITNEI